MDNRPTGNVTFLFTDIVGSTRLAQQYSDTYNEILKKHDSILDKIIADHNGHVFKKIGDAYCVSFHNPNDALAAAHEIQKKLEEHDWNEIELRIRIGIHSGDAEFLNNDYIGYITLSRVNRIMSVANGGQILVTQEIYDSALEAPPPGISFRDLGERRLKDIILPEHIYQVLADDLQSDFPPLKSLDVRPNNLPIQITKFIGREKELTTIKNLLSNTRKLTIFGPGGTGKTRLAVKVASDIIDEFENGVWFIELSSIKDPDLVEKEISLTLNLKEEGDKETIDSLIEYLKSKQILLILDNSEHLIEKCASLAHTLLQACPKLKIISTSRESFNIAGETIYRVPPLSTPSSLKKLTAKTIEQYESARLFIDRATAIKHDFKVTDENVNALAELCRRLDGIPFAIELAATRVNILPVEKILDRLNDRFKLLSRGSSTALPRHQTLRAMIDWSYDLLNEHEKILLQRLSIFMGGWTLEAAEMICSDEIIDEYEVLDILTSLESKSLINVNEQSGNIRYNMLETIKQYSLEKFTDKSPTQAKYFEFFMKLSDLQEQRSKGIEQTAWVRLVDDDFDNMRAAIQIAFDTNPENAYKIIPLIGSYWLIKGYFREGLQACLKALENKTVEDKKLRARVLLTAAEMCFGLGDLADLQTFADESLALSREINDKEGIAASLIQLGNVNYTNVKIEESKKYYDEALAISNEIGSQTYKAKSLSNLSFIVDDENNTALNMMEEALKIYRSLKDTYNVAFVLAVLGRFELLKKNLDRANIFSEESLAISRENDDQYLISINLINLARIYSEKNDFAKAEYSLEDSLKIIREYGYTLNLHPALISLAEIHHSKGDIDKSIATYKEYLEGSSKSGGNFFLKRAFIGLAGNYVLKEDYKQALICLSFIEMTAEATQSKMNKTESETFEMTKQKIREKLGDEAFDQYWNEGRLYSIEKAVSYN